MKIVLTEMGFAPEMALNGKHAVELLRHNAYDLVLMDLHMPIMDGFEATGAIRHELGLTVPIIALTADVTTTDIHRIRESGMNDYATKPIDREKLCRQIMQHTKKTLE